MTNNKGFTLVELVVVMAIFVGLMLIISSAFSTLIGKGGQQMRSAETNTEGIVGLEMLRGDIEHAGFGLPWTYPIAPNPAITETNGDTGVTGITISGFAETAPPRAVQVATSSTTGRIIAGSATTNPGVAYLVIKSTRVALSDTARKWAYVNYSSQAGANSSYVKKWGTSDDFNTNGAQDRVITISSTFTTTGEPDRKLAMDNTNNPNFSYTIPDSTPIFPPGDGFKPGDASQLYVVYGVDPGTNLKMPYNRADYYVKKPTANMPQNCNPGTGILYKGVVKQSDQNFLEYPLLNCVGDMQLEFELDPNNNGNITYTSSLAGLSAAGIRSQLKRVKVYILSHEGKKDRNYSYSNDTIQVGDSVRPISSGRTWDSSALQTTFGADWRNYRWKVYTIVVQPKNLD